MAYKPLSPTQLAWRRFRRNRLAIIGLLIVLIFIAAGMLAPAISPFPYDKTNLFKTWLPPGRDSAHLLGTDELGCDILSRLIWGARVSLVVSLAATTIVVALALLFGSSQATSAAHGISATASYRSRLLSRYSAGRD